MCDAEGGTLSRDHRQEKQAEQLMQLLDKLNLRYSKDTLRFAAMGTTQEAE